MVGSLVIVGEGWGKIRRGKQFVGFWKLFAYLVLEAIIVTFASDFVISNIEMFLLAHLEYLVGITTAVLGTFFIWFVYTFDFNIRTQNKWVFPLVCYIITVANYYWFNQ